MEKFVALLESYGLLVVLAGLISSILCGFIKIPVVNHIKKNALKKGLGEKAVTARITNVCTIIVGFFSIVLIAVYACVTAHSFKPLLTAELYSQILLSMSFAKIAYTLYEGAGVVSLKKWMHQLFAYIKAKHADRKIDSVQDYIDVLQQILTEELHMPLTDHQKDLLKQALHSKKSKSE